MKPLITIAPISSSTVKKIGYRDTTLFVEFKNEGAYRFEGVPAEVFITLINAESVGGYFHSHIKGKYVYSKLLNSPFDAPAP